MVMIAIYFLASVAIMHLSLWFLERDKASPGKAAFACLLFTLGINIFGLALTEVDLVARLVVYFLMASALVWLVFKIRLHNALTVAAVFIVGRLVVINFLAFVDGLAANA
jgi:ABC-type transport system involved in cytochrome bd biosynthesis fused ATPase/permease subunit